MDVTQSLVLASSALLQTRAHHPSRLRHVAARCAYEPLNPGNVDERDRAWFESDPEGFLRRAFEKSVQHEGARHGPCQWGFKIFPNHVSRDTLAWLWNRLDAAIILEREDGAASHLGRPRSLSSRPRRPPHKPNPPHIPDLHISPARALRAS